jgi:ATP-dependent helicase/nuclease subunit A
MSEVTLTREQDEAARLLDRNVALTAGAGCGKTLTLVERFVNILKGGAQVSEIAAITFTEKAANELKEKVHKRLRELALSEADAVTRERRRKDLAAIETAQIGTIHSFCAQILREFAVEANVDPAFGVGEEFEAQMLAEAAARDALFAAVNEGDPAARKLLERFEYGQLSLWLVESLSGQEETRRAEKRFAAEGKAKDAAGALKAAAVGAAERVALAAITSQEFERAVSFLSGVEGDEDDKLEEKRKAFLAAHEEWRASKGSELADALEKMAEAVGELRGGSAKKWGIDVKEVKVALKTVGDAAEGARARIEALLEDDWGLAASQMFDFLRLHKAALAHYTARKLREGILDFDDLVILTRDLVAQNGRVAEALAGRYRFILVDEFQDTDYVQYEIVAALSAKGANLFVVGDREQSIYGFRGAQVEVFSGLVQEYASRGGGEVRRLSINHRAVRHVTEFVNVLFGRMMPAGGGEGWRISHEPLRAERSGAAARVEFIVAQSDGDLDYSRRVEAGTIARRIKEIIETATPAVWAKDGDGKEAWRGARYSDIAILFRAMGSVGIYERELAAADIPYYTIAGSTYYTRQEVKDLISLLRFVVNADDTLALVAALRSPLFAVSDDLLATLACARPLGEYFGGGEAECGKGADAEAFRRAVETIARLRTLKDRVGAHEIVDAIFEATGYPAALSMLYLGRQKAANALKLRQAAAAFDARGAGTLEDFVRHVAELEVREARESEALVEDERSNVVRLMTIHNAKGLEFPIVIVADMGRKRNARGGGGAFIDRELGICLPPPGEKKAGYYETATAAQKQREEEEEKRIFYVAATRARDHLILTGAARRQSQTMKVEGWAGEALDALEMPVEEAGDYEFGAVTVEYSCPSAPAGGARRQEPAILAWRDRLVAGTRLPKGGGIDREAAARCRPLGAEAYERRRFTATELADFHRCPLRYELAHLRRLPADYILEDREEGGGPPAAVVGTLLHEVLEKARRREALSDALERVISGNASYSARGAQLRSDCLAVLERFEGSAFHRRVSGAVEQRRERQFSFLLGEYLIEGKMDLVVAGEVIDFKSDDVRAEDVRAYAEHYRTQMDVYALAYERLTGRTAQKVTLYFLRPGVEAGWEYGADGTRAAEARALATIKEILTGPPYEAVRDDSCRCEYKTLCGLVAGRRAAKR